MSELFNWRGNLEIALRQDMWPSSEAPLEVRLQLCLSGLSRTVPSKTTLHKFDSLSLHGGKSQPDRDQVYVRSPLTDHQLGASVGAGFVSVRTPCNFLSLSDCPSSMGDGKPLNVLSTQRSLSEAQWMAITPSAGFAVEENADKSGAGRLDFCFTPLTRWRCSHSFKTRSV